jgi:hypothetical protein
MRGDYIIQRLRNDGISLRADRGQVRLTPKECVKAEHRELVREHKAEILLALAAWPKGEARARNYILEPVRPDERALRQPPRPVALTGRSWRR